MTRLGSLDISNTDIDQGLEYLPDSVEDFYCSIDEKKDAKLRNIINLLGEQGKVETDKDGRIMNLPLLRVHKQAPEQTKINFLEQRVQELIDLIEKQKGKITDAYLHFCQEEKLLKNKNLLKELITMHLEITGFRKKNTPIEDYRQQLQTYNTVRLQLFNELNDLDLVEEVEKILKDCEDLVTWELELEAKLNNKALLIEG